MKIGLFGGSFDPIHKGHVSVAKTALVELGLDEIQLIPTKNNPCKQGTQSTVNQRLAMINLAIKDEKDISINCIEINMEHNEKNYTIDTLRKLKQEHPDYEYYYIMGMDQAMMFDKWKDAKEISEVVQLVAFLRSGYPMQHENLEKYHFQLLHNKPIHASSSEIRDGHLEMLDVSVLKYISNEGLYLDTMIKPRMKEKRWRHTLSVASLAKEIALSNGLDGKKAYIAGMLHDVAKEMDETQARQLMTTYYPQFLNKPMAIWHQWLSAYVAKNDFLIKDKVILKAIEDHTTASLDISSIGKCVYVADKLDPLRGYDSSSQIQRCKDNIHLGFKEELIHFYDYSLSQGRDIDDIFYEIYNRYVVKGEI